MRPFIINAHMGENENQVLLWLSLAKFHIMPKRTNSNVVLFSDELEKKGHKVLEFKFTKFFTGDGSQRDGGYIFFIIPSEEYHCPEDQLMKDVHQVLKDLGSL